MAPRKPSSTAEVALVPLKNCLVNLPPSLTALLVNANAVCPLGVLGIGLAANGCLDGAKCHC